MVFENRPNRTDFIAVLVFAESSQNEGKSYFGREKKLSKNSRVWCQIEGLGMLEQTAIMILPLYAHGD